MHAKFSPNPLTITEANETLILIVDDHDVVRRGLADIVSETTGGKSQVITASSGYEARIALAENRVDLCLLDIELPDTDGLALLHETRKAWPKMKIIVCTMHDELWFVKNFLDARVDGILFKDVYAREISNAILSVMSGTPYYCKQVESVRRIILSYDAPTRRETDVLHYISLGMSTKEIATRMGVSNNTVETHRRHLLEKFHARNVAELVSRAYRDKLL